MASFLYPSLWSFFALLTWWAIFRLVYFTRTWLILNFVAKTCLVWQDPIMMKYIDISVVPCVTIWNSRKWIQICFVCWMSIVYACCLLYVIVKTVKDLLLFLQKWMYIWNKHRSFPRSMKSMFTMSSGLIKCGWVNIVILTKTWQMANQRLAWIPDIIPYNYHQTIKTHGMICDIIIFEHPFNSAKTKIINKSTFKDLMNPLKKVLSWLTSHSRMRNLVDDTYFEISLTSNTIN